MEKTRKVLFVLTSHGELGNTGDKTGFWIEEFAAPYYVLADAGAEITVASPDGGQPPVDPKSENPDMQTDATRRFYRDAVLIDKVAHTVKLNEINEAEYDAVFYPGGHGPLWDLSTDATSVALIEKFHRHNKPMAFVCHAPAALVNVKNPDGEPLVSGKEVTGFSNSEEKAVNLASVVPFLLEDTLKNLGGHYSSGPDWGVFIKKDGLLITGQNPASSEGAARTLLEIM